jgi:alanyl-tRNA synthetase
VRTSAELREGFLAFMEEKGHTRLPSWPLIPRAGDTSTLLTTAGMQPQMPFFLGREQPPAPLTTTSQKCFRTPDIDEVGRDGHHLTFFEMLGNFSFGQYFKGGAVDLAKEFVVERLGLDWERIWVTVHAGDPGFELGPDEVAIAEWERVGMPSERIVALPSSENFWSVGGPGPCGPDSEIYWDWGPEHGCGEPGCAPACPRCDRFLEFWNLVFMEYEQHPDGKLTPLPEQNIDTGMGLERLSAIVQDVPNRSVYETDGYQAIMTWVAEQSGVAFGDSEAATKAHRVLADHGRGMTFLVGDGVTPSNEGRGYVLRRIIRRAVQQARTIGLDDLWRLSEVVVEQMGPWYPELPENRARIAEVLRAEEERFTETLARGMTLFEEVAARGAISGKDAFDLTATYGFPFELTSELALERGLPVDDAEYRRLMDEHREISRGATGARATGPLPGPATEFVGYEQTEVLTAITALSDLGDGLFEAKLERSPFYPAGGGQVTDAGWIEHDETGARAELREAHRFGDDQTLVFEGAGFAEGDRVRAVVPWPVRFPTMANHTATHLLHEALRRVLGEHVAQAGSAVRPDKLRFDFTHEAALTPEQRREVEELVNEQIFSARPVRIFETPLEEARRLGAQMLFGEKYGDVVRVVEIDGFSRELCGGTHVRSTAEIGPFVILSEGSVGSGARRIEAVTSGDAFALLHERAREGDALRTQLADARKAAKKGDGKAAADFTVQRETAAGDVTVLVVDVASGDPLEVSDKLKQQHAPAAVIVGVRDNGAAQLLINLDKSLEGRGVDAGAVIREAAALIGGKGGGRPTMARAGGKDAAGLPDAVALAEKTILEALS